MFSGRFRAAAVTVPVAVILIAASACASGDDAERVASSPLASAATDPPEPSAGSSVVAGVSPDELRSLVAEEPAPAVRRRPGPTAEQIVLADGTEAWRVRVPGSFTMGGARPFVLVDGKVVGQGVLTPALDALVVIVPSADAVADGAAVSVRWEQGTPQGMGRLAVLR